MQIKLKKEKIINDMKAIPTNKWLIIEFEQSYRTLSWAVTGGGFNLTRYVVWRHITECELIPAVDPGIFLEEEIRAAGIDHCVGLLTSAHLGHYSEVSKSFGDYTARCVSTVGLGNALRVADFPTAANQIGTINILCQLSVPLSNNAFIEAISIATEARTLAVLEADVPSIRTKKSATGTGTDCTVIAAPDSGQGRSYAGKHTVLGHLIGLSVYHSVKSGIERWKVRKRLPC